MKAFLILTLAAVFAYGAYKECRPVEKTPITATVTAGDTLWGLVTDAMECAGDERTVDEVIYYTKKANGITDAGALPVGAVLVIPCERGI